MDKILNNIGDSIIVRVSSKTNGIVTLTGFSDVLVGITSGKYVTKSFRLTTDDIFYTDWLELTSGNLISKTDVTVDKIFTIEIKYIRTGIDSTGTIEFVSIDFTGTNVPKLFNKPTIDKSIFSEIIKNPLVLSIEKNLFKKLYFRGILPSYILRGDDSNKVEDSDFITLFSSIAKFFALIIQFSKRFEDFNIDIELLRENVRQNNLYFDESNISLEELQFLTYNLYNEIRKRGTSLIFKRKGDILSDSKVVEIDGEFLRLFCVKPYDEFLTSKVPASNFGWCMGKSSPLYRGTGKTMSLNKTKENSEDFISLDNFVISADSENTVALEDFEEKKVLKLTAVNGECGLGRLSEFQEINNLITINSSIDYEITFSFKIDSSTSGDILKFGVEGFDIRNNKLNDAFITKNGNSISELFFELNLTNFATDVWYNIRGIIHGYGSLNYSIDSDSLEVDNKLYFNNKFTRFISPKIQLHSTVSTDLRIWDYKVRPLVWGRNILEQKDGNNVAFSNGFVQAKNLFYIFVKNNNKNLSSIEIEEIANRYLLPYNFNNILISI